ncbi:MAG: division/cell wall cluster transcriptional repressor MraZ [Dehalococcoidia bacterium]|nr:division/cell wall cluster transcriptional repressor MraZ [Dehalococcoidia bacterium]
MTTFYGSFAYSLDDRGRLAVPPRYRSAFAAGLVLRAGPEGCIEMYTLEGFESEKELLLGEHRSTRSQHGRRLRRGFLAGVTDLEMDGQWRVLLSAPIRESAGLTDRAVVVGCGDYIEIWDPARWETELANVEREIQADGLSAAAGDIS